VDFPDTPGFGFPVRFRVEASDEPGFASAQMISDHTSQDFKNLGDSPVAFPASPREGRFIRVTATRLWERTSDFVFALAELQVLVNGTNAALGAAVSALDSIEEGHWAKKYLVVGFDSRHRLTVTPSLAKQKLEAEIRAAIEKRKLLMEALTDEATRNELNEVSNRFDEINQEIAKLPPSEKVYADASDFKPGSSFLPPKTPRQVYVLAKGDVKRPSELARPAALAAVPGPNPDLAKYVENIGDSVEEGPRRAGLAKWITDPENMLTRRSIVNRLWQ